MALETSIAELQVNAQIKKVRSEAESTRLRAIADSETIRAIDKAKVKSYRAGTQSLGTREFTSLQPMQIIGDNRVKIVSEVQANGAGFVEAFIGLLAQRQLGFGVSSDPVTGLIITPPSTPINSQTDK